MRLQKLIALASELSRRTAEEAIAKGAVTVNGAVVTAMGTSVDPAVDKVCVNGKPLQLPTRFFYLAMYKPRRVLVTKGDPRGRKTVWDYLEGWREKLNSAGRLDYESEGLLLLTNDGEMINSLTHPKHEIKKVYVAKVKGEPTEQTIEKLRSGIALEEGKTLPAEIKVVRVAESNMWLQIAIREGKYRQIRRMCEAVGHPVLKLKRVSIGPVRLGQMKAGEWRYMSQKEVYNLEQALAGRALAGRVRQKHGPQNYKRHFGRG
jgi:pseudouridine synthase